MADRNIASTLHSMDRASTPPAKEGGAPSSPSTPDQVRLIRENRLKAKAKIQELAAAKKRITDGRPSGPIRAETHHDVRLGKRGIPSTSRNADLDARDGAPDKRRRVQQDDLQAPLPRDHSLGQYIEFDLSKLQNSKGGFLLDEDDSGHGKLKSLEELHREREREKQRIRAQQEPGISLDPEKQRRCRECNTQDIDDQLSRVFNINVCKRCTREKPEKYSLLTKTEVKEDYLLTDSELRDSELLPHLLKANPHKATYSNMMLFLRCQVEEYAFGPDKWGSEEGLDAEFHRREDEKAKKRGKKFAQKLADLRRRTRDNVWQKRQDARHVHNYQPVHGAEHEDVQRCEDCGHEVHAELF